MGLRCLLLIKHIEKRIRTEHIKKFDSPRPVFKNFGEFPPSRKAYMESNYK